MPAAATGTLTPVRISLASMALVKGPRKKSPAATEREPPLLVSVSSAPAASSDAGQSAAGSAWTTLPPMVPRLRTWGSPMLPATLASSAQFSLTSLDVSTW